MYDVGATRLPFPFGDGIDSDEFLFQSKIFQGFQ